MTRTPSRFLRPSNPGVIISSQHTIQSTQLWTTRIPSVLLLRRPLLAAKCADLNISHPFNLVVCFRSGKLNEKPDSLTHKMDFYLKRGPSPYETTQKNICGAIKKRVCIKK